MCTQNFITIDHSVRPFSLFQNLELGTASTDFKCHFATWQSLCLDHVSSNVYAKFYQNIPKGSRDRASFTFSEFEPRQNLDQSQMIFDNLVRYILSISMCMQNFIAIFHSVQEIGPFSLFQNLDNGGRNMRFFF